MEMQKGTPQKDGNKVSEKAQGPQVTRRRFRNTAMTVPLLGFGCMRLPLSSSEHSKIDVAVVRKMVARAMESGCNYFDTAYMYHEGASECCLGEVLQEYSRDSYYLADKMPLWMTGGTAAGVERIFQDQLKRCRTEYFDFYLVHSLNADSWETCQKLKTVGFLEKMREAGRIRRIGFSFHDSPEVFEKILQAHPWDFAQIQLNYLDWELTRAREQYELAEKAGVPLVIMEPLRGGALATLSPDATQILRAGNPDASNAAWGFRYVASLPNVMCVLSGMSLPEQLEDNLRTFSPLQPLSEEERKILDEALLAYKKCLAVPCTGCRYCMPCPVGVEIPKIFGLYNQYKASGNKWQFQMHYDVIPKKSHADACVNCKRCMQHCPQKIRIPDELVKIKKIVR